MSESRSSGAAGSALLQRQHRRRHRVLPRSARARLSSFGRASRLPAGAYRLFVVVGRPRPAMGPCPGRAVVGRRRGRGEVAPAEAAGPGCPRAGRPLSRAILNFTRGRQPVPRPGGAAGHVSAGGRLQPLGRRGSWRRPPGRLFCVARCAPRPGPPPLSGRALRGRRWAAGRGCQAGAGAPAASARARSGARRSAARAPGRGRGQPARRVLGLLRGRPAASARLRAPERGRVGAPRSAARAGGSAGRAGPGAGAVPRTAGLSAFLFCACRFPVKRSRQPRPAAGPWKFIPLCILQYPPFFCPLNNEPLAILGRILFPSPPVSPRREGVGAPRALSDPTESLGNVTGTGGDVM